MVQSPALWLWIKFFQILAPWIDLLWVMKLRQNWTLGLNSGPREKFNVKIASKSTWIKFLKFYFLHITIFSVESPEHVNNGTYKHTWPHRNATMQCLKKLIRMAKLNCQNLELQWLCLISRLCKLARYCKKKYWYVVPRKDESEGGSDFCYKSLSVQAAVVIIEGPTSGLGFWIDRVLDVVSDGTRKIYFSLSISCILNVWGNGI